MNIRPKNIPKFQNGGVPQWYLNRYGNRTSLLGWNSNLRYNYSNNNLNINDHRNAGNLETAYNKNIAYTGTPGVITSDIQSFYDSDGKGMSAEDFVNFYNSKAADIRKHWGVDQTYGTKNAQDHNRLFRRMFKSRSDQNSVVKPSDYNIGYQDNLDNIEGSSTWLRRMDQYENEFDINNPDNNRVHEILLSNGNKVKVYKKANGDIGLFSNTPNNPPSSTPQENVEQKLTGINPAETKDKESIWGNVLSSIKGQAPNLIEALRLGINLNNNKRIFDTMMQAIRPNLQQSYNTHRQIVGDEATKQGFYRRAAQGESKAAKPFTSDADRQMAYMMEAKRVGDELRAQGDLADNQEIRRTSDESNQHQWANVQRDTEVANHNTIELNQANAAKRQQEALKYSADTSSWDNYLMSIENRIRQQDLKKESVEDQIKSLQMQDDLDNDPGYRNAYTALETAIKNNTSSSGINWEAPEVKQAQQNLQKIKRQAYIKYFKIYYGKRGTKMEYSRDDKYLYKTSRDIVDHFRKMTKITDDSRIRTRGKTVKLSSHPKKYQQGGVAPYTVFRPVSLMGPSMGTTTSNGSSAKSTSSKEDPAKNKLDMVKELFKSIQGLPIDTDLVYSELDNLFKRYQAFGQEMSTDDITSIYLRAMQRISHLKYSQSEYDKALQVATSNDALGEFAVGADGEIVVQNLDTGEIKKTTLNQFKNLEGRWNPLKNSQLLTARAHSKNFAFDDTIFNIVNNGIGLSKIANHIKSLAGSLSVPERKLEGISEVQAGRVKSGLQVFSGFSETPDGYYKISQDIKDPNSTVSAALRYIYGILPENYKTILKLHAGGDEGAKDLIISFLTSQTSTSYKEDIAPLTGKASDKDPSKGINSNFLDQVQRDQIGVDRPFELITKDNNSKLYSLNSKYISQLPNVSEDMSLNEMLGKSKIGSIMDSRLGVTFGDQVINPDNFKDIMFDPGGGATIVTLPCKYENGHKVVNFAIKDEYDSAVKEVSNTIPVDYTNPRFIQKLAEKLHEKGLDSLLNGSNLDPNMFGHFMVVSAYTTDKVKFKTDSNYIEKVKNPDKDLENRIIKGLSTNKDKNDYELDVDDKWGWFELTYDDIYRGNVFIPLNNDPVSAQTGWGSDNNLTETRQLAEQYQNFQKSSKQKDSSSSNL